MLTSILDFVIFRKQFHCVIIPVDKYLIYINTPQFLLVSARCTWNHRTNFNVAASKVYIILAGRLPLALLVDRLIFKLLLTVFVFIYLRLIGLID